MRNQPADAAALSALPSLAGGLEVVAARYLGDPEDVRDAVQETLARAVDAVESGRQPLNASLAAYVHGIARHVIADVLRRRAREPRASRDPGQLVAVDPGPLERLISAEERALVRQALSQLPRAERELLRLCFVDGERLVDIAARWGVPPERVRKRKSRAMARLRSILAGSSAGHVSPRSPDILTGLRSDEVT